MFTMTSGHPIRLPSDAGDRVTLLGILWNVVLFVVKLAVGLLTGSAGLIADGIHSASDMATDLAVRGGRPTPPIRMATAGLRPSRAGSSPVR